MDAGNSTIGSHVGKPRRGTAVLRLIGVFKLFKGLLLLIGAIWALHLRGENLTNVALAWARRLHVAPGNRTLEDILIKLPALSERKLSVVAAVLCAYSAMFTVEGIGLLCAKYWAEWMTVI